MTNSIRPVVVASLLVAGEAQSTLVPEGNGRRETEPAVSLEDKFQATSSGTTRGAWRRNDQKVQRVKWGDLLRTRTGLLANGLPSPPSRSQSVHSSVETE
jgi:hypothetical protein